MERFRVHHSSYTGRLQDHYLLVDVVLRMVKDIGDDVFLFALERAFAPPFLPFATFSFAPSLSSADLPFPW